MRLALAISGLLVCESLPTASASVDGGKEKIISLDGGRSPAAIKEATKKRRHGRHRAARFQRKTKDLSFVGEHDDLNPTAPRPLVNGRRKQNEKYQDIQGRSDLVDKGLMDDVAKHLNTQLHHRECDPTGTATADQGLLASCADHEYCTESLDSSMGGYCMEKSIDDNEQDRKLQTSILIPTSVCDPDSGYYNGYYESCDCGRFNLQRDTGSFVCTYVEYYCFYDGICGATTASMRKLTDGSASSSFCYEFQTPLAMLACYSYRVDPTPSGTSCSVVVDGVTCDRCEIDFTIEHPYYPDSPYGCFQFDCRNTIAEMVGNSCSGGYLLDGLVTAIYYQQLETSAPTKSPDPTKSPTKSPTKAPSKLPTDTPTEESTGSPTSGPSVNATYSPSQLESEIPSASPSGIVETVVPSSAPSILSEPLLNMTLPPSNATSSNNTANSTIIDLQDEKNKPSELRTADDSGSFNIHRNPVQVILPLLCSIMSVVALTAYG